MPVRVAGGTISVRSEWNGSPYLGWLIHCPESFRFSPTGLEGLAWMAPLHCRWACLP